MVNLIPLRQRMCLRALRWRILLRAIPTAYKIITVITVAILVLVVSLWAHFGTDESLPVLADSTPILLAIAGIIMSYIQPKKEAHLITSFILILVGLAGSAVLTAVRIKNEHAHTTEMTNLQGSVQEVGKQNDWLAKFLISKESTVMTEADKQKGILMTLRSKYILSHNPIDPEILAGNKLPPASWMNERLKEMGQSWTVKDTPPHEPLRPQITQVLPPEDKQVRVVFGLYETDFTDHPQTVKVDALDGGKGVFSVSAIVVGDSPAENLQIWARECAKCTWVSSQPGFNQDPNEDHYFDEIMFIPSAPENVGFGRWNFTVQLPTFPRYESVPLAFYYTCKTCPPVDWKKPQRVFLTQTMQSAAKLLIGSPSISDIPAREH